MYDMDDDSTQDGDEEYPSFRSAIRSDAAVNIYCGLKWVLWHLFYALYATLATLTVAIIGSMLFAYSVGAFIGGHIAMRLSDVFWGYVHPTVAPRLSGATTTAAKKPKEVNRRTRRTPVLRRLYGYCPVDINAVKPRWFEAISDRGVSAVQSVEGAITPPKRGWVCSQCGGVQTQFRDEIRPRSMKPRRCRESCDRREREDATFEWVRVEKGDIGEPYWVPLNDD